MPRQTWAACIVCILQITEHLWWNYIYSLSINTMLYTFVGSVWSFGFFIPATTVNDLRLRRIFYPIFYPLHLFSFLNSLERASFFSFWMLSAKQGHYWYHFYNVFGMTRSLTGDWTGTSCIRSQHSTTRISRRR